MKESSTYQAILEEGRQEGLQEGLQKGLSAGAVAEAKKVLRLQGDGVFGDPDARTAAAIERIDDLPQLEDLLRRLPSAGSWQELLGQPTTSRRSKRRPSS